MSSDAAKEETCAWDKITGDTKKINKGMQNNEKMFTKPVSKKSHMIAEKRKKPLPPRAIKALDDRRWPK